MEANPNFRAVVRALRLQSEGKCPHCGRKMPKPKKENDEPIQPPED